MTPELQALYQKKQEALLALFPSRTPSFIYEKIIEMGKALPRPTKNIQSPTNIIEGCQSVAYLCSHWTPQSTIFYELDSEALISRGLGALLLFVYSNEPPELILLYPPLFIQELGLYTALSPGRSSGLHALFQRMKKDALLLYTSHKN